MHKVEALEGVVLLDAAEEVHAAVLAGVALDGGGLVDDGQLGPVGGHGELVAGHDGNHGEERAGGLPALGAAAGVVVEDVGGERHFDGGGAALAVQLAAGEVGAALGEAVVDEGVERRRHFGVAC